MQRSNLRYWYRRTVQPLLLLLASIVMPACARKPPPVGMTTGYPAYDAHINRLLRQSVPLLDVDSLYRMRSEVHIFDARKAEEYAVSHLPGASRMPYPQVDDDLLRGISVDDVIVVYCTVGYRSERIGEELLQRGYQRVYNLYGSILAWANRGYPLVDDRNEPTERVHTYSRRWSKWLYHSDRQGVW